MVAIIAILCFALRIYGIDWDQGAYLHPDERFLAMTITRLGVPQTLSEYLDPSISPLVPFARGLTFFVYGSLPTTVILLTSRILHLESMKDTIILGRFFSAALDTGVGIFLYLIVRELSVRYSHPKFLPHVSFALYAITVFAIQQAHFFTVDSWMVFGIAASIYCFLRYVSSSSTRWLLAGSVFMGLAVASKITAIFFLPCVLLLFLKKESIARKALRLGASLLVVALVLRVASPSYFHPKFLTSIQELRLLTSVGTTFPPSLQWYSKSFVSPLLDSIFWGVGLPQGAVLLLGVIYVIVSRARGIQGRETVLLLAIFGVFAIYQASQFVTSMRYFYPLYPLFAVGCAASLIGIWRYSRMSVRILLVLGLLLWPLAFMHIYSRPHARVEASAWISQNVAPASFILVEHWDDVLPIAQYNTPQMNYQIRELEIYAPEKTSQEQKDKQERINALLDQSDYIIVSSNRGYGSLLPLGAQYPIIATYYSQLFREELGFKKVATFDVRPQICIRLRAQHCLTINDLQADESFTVYDHPRVEIFKKVVR